MEVSRHIHDLVVNEILPDLGMDPNSFWARLEEVITEMTPKNNILLLKRYKLQASIDTWHQSRCDSPHNHAEYTRFLQKIGYLLPEGPDFAVNTDHVDEEITTIAGPQLVVPVKNARFALNAANARRMSTAVPTARSAWSLMGLRGVPKTARIESPPKRVTTPP